MSNSNVTYAASYFEEGIFDTDYATLAAVIVKLYKPRTIAEFGCGPGHLSRELAKLGVQVTAVDGYSNPNFGDLPIEFQRLNLNELEKVSSYFANKQFDLAISLEVAEHLQPDTSANLVKWLTQAAPVAIFSAAVPGQGGHGHINLRSREYWHGQFTLHDFVVADRIREQLREISTVAPWYKYNVLDYVHSQNCHAPNPTEVVSRLIASESAAATAYYEEATQKGVLEGRLRYAPVKTYLAARRFAKQFIGRG